MHIWVDADACPVVTREVLYRAANRSATLLTLVANQSLRAPTSPYIRCVQVERGFDAADKEIARAVNAGDLVITSDIPLAAEVVGKGALALDPRGELFNRDNVKARLNMRDFLDTMRSSGVNTGGAAPISQTERQRFANQLDRLLAKAAR